jgi:hypothetical protein
LTESETEPKIHRETSNRPAHPERAVFGVVFVMLLAFTHSQELVTGLFKVIGHGHHDQWRASLVVVDVLLLAAVGMMKRSITRSDGDAPRLWRWWWVGFGLLIVLDVILYVIPTPLALNVVLSTAYAACLGFLMAASLNADPLTLFSVTRRLSLTNDWRRVRAIVPLILGTWACYIAATTFVDFFDVDTVRELDSALAADVDAMPLPEQLGALSQLCQGAISPGFFQQVVSVLPLLLLTLGVEFSYFRQTLIDPTQRAVTAATVTIMSAGLVFALSTLPWDGEGCGDVLSGWHEYLTFVLSVQGIFTGLATLVWLLISSTPDISDG